MDDIGELQQQPLAGNVALVTGAARGQGRAEAVMLAASTPADLDDTARRVTETGRRFVGVQADVRDAEAVAAAVADGVAQLGRLGIVVAKAGVSTWGRLWELLPEEWRVTIDVNLNGVWHTLRAGSSGDGALRRRQARTCRTDPGETPATTLSAPEDIAPAVLFLAGDEARSITGIQLPVDRGATII